MPSSGSDDYESELEDGSEAGSAEADAKRHTSGAAQPRSPDGTEAALPQAAGSRQHAMAPQSPDPVTERTHLPNVVAEGLLELKLETQR